MEQLIWRLENGELPPVTPPKVIVLAVGSNSKGMVSALETCQCVRHLPWQMHMVHLSVELL